VTNNDPDRLPTFEDMSGKCPRCGALSNFSLANHQPLRVLNFMSPPGPGGSHPQSRTVEQVTVLECMGCKKMSVVIEAEIGDQYGPVPAELKGVLWWPADHLADLERVAGVPPEIVAAYSEGVRCLSVQAPNAAAAMIRTTIAQIVQNKGSEAAKKKNTLNEAIKQMVADRALWEDFGGWADHVRLTGNAGAHGEKFDPITMEQAAELKKFIREIINFLYEQPARRAAAKPVTKQVASPAAGSSASGSTP
jgi:hypothetical protein